MDKRWIIFFAHGQKKTSARSLIYRSRELKNPLCGAYLGVRFIHLPYTIGKLLSWQLCWFWRYHIKGAPYTWEDASYRVDPLDFRPKLGKILPIGVSLFSSTKTSGSFPILRTSHVAVIAIINGTLDGATTMASALSCIFDTPSRLGRCRWLYSYEVGDIYRKK